MIMLTRPINNIACFKTFPPFFPIRTLSAFAVIKNIACSFLNCSFLEERDQSEQLLREERGEGTSPAGANPKNLY
jgi:hypothetical protein